MEPGPNQNIAGADKIAAAAALMRQIRADQKAGKQIDPAAILKANPELANLLKPELEKLRPARQAGSQAGQSTTTFVSDQVKTVAAPAIEIPGYSIINEIGRGGQAVVYLGIQQSTGRKRALKVLREGRLADAQATARFGREIATLASLNHPNIVPIIDTGQTSDGHRFMVMDYIAGSSLDEYMLSRHASDPDDPSKLLKLFLKICAAVNVAQRSGIIHRDLKPSNILIDERGEPHVLDFGLARTAMDRFIRGDSGQVSVTGEFLGSLPWSSPEQAEGDPDKIDIRTDVYSLGVILYQILTGGNFPYVVVGNIRDVLNNILTAQPTPPTQVMAAARARESRVRRQAATQHQPAVNEAIEQIVLKALAKKPEARYQTAGELGRDVSNYLYGRPTARLTAEAPPPWRPSRRKYAVASATVIVAVAALITFQKLTNSPRHVALQAQPTTVPAMLAWASAPPAGAPPMQTPSLSGPPRNFPVQSILNGAAHLDGADLVLTPRTQFACCFFIGDLTWANYDLTFKAIANSDDGFSVWLHWTAPGTFVGFSPASTALIPEFWTRQGGEFERLRARAARIEPDRWHDIRVVVRGSALTCFVDGEQWFQDSAAGYTHGRIALTTKSAAARFRDIRVTAPDGNVMYSGPPDLSSLPATERDANPAPAPAPAMKRIDLLKLLNPSKNTISGYWNLNDGVLSTAEGAKAQIEFPYTPPQEYDYRIQLERSRGTAPVSLICVGGGHEFSWVLGGAKNTISGLAMLDGKNFDDNPSTVTRARPLIVNGQPHLLVVTVRKEIVRAFIDGIQHCVLKTDYKNLTIDPALQQPGKTTLGLCCNGDSISVQSADVLEIAAEAKPAPGASTAP